MSSPSSTSFRMVLSPYARDRFNYERGATKTLVSFLPYSEHNPEEVIVGLEVSHLDYDDYIELIISPGQAVINNTMIAIDEPISLHLDKLLVAMELFKGSFFYFPKNSRDFKLGFQVPTSFKRLLDLGPRKLPNWNFSTFNKQIRCNFGLNFLGTFGGINQIGFQFWTPRKKEIFPLGPRNSSKFHSGKLVRTPLRPIWNTFRVKVPFSQETFPNNWFLNLFTPQEKAGKLNQGQETASRKKNRVKGNKVFPGFFNLGFP